MIILTEKNVDHWKLPVSGWVKAAGEFTQEKQGTAGPATFVMMVPGFIGVVALVGGFFEKSWRLGLAGAAVLMAIAGALWVLCKVAEPFFEARWNAIDRYLTSLPLEQVVHQATHLGPGYLGRQFLLDHLDNRDAQWSTRNLVELVTLVRAEELPENQRASLRYYLTENHPGWSGAGTEGVNNLSA